MTYIIPLATVDKIRASLKPEDVEFLRKISEKIASGNPVPCFTYSIRDDLTVSSERVVPVYNSE
jgi:hypothetical protein